MEDLDDLELEYIQLNQNLRHYHDHRFKQLALWVTITGALLTSLFSKTYRPDMIPNFIIKSIGVTTSLCFWIMDIRVVDHWRSFWERLKEIEKEKKFRMWTQRPKRKWIGSTRATYSLYLITIIFWCSMFFINLPN